MTGTRARQVSSSSTSEPRFGAGLPGVYPEAKVLVDNYNGSIQGADDDHNRYKLSLSDHPQQSPLLNTDDAVAMHLLMETAIGDSQQFSVLSYEETDSIKKELSILTTSIDGTKRRLVFETKLRDAALSLDRLQDPTPSDVAEGSSKAGERHRRSMMGSRGSKGDMLNKSDDEMAVSSRKCEELSQELWRLEKRAETLQTALLEHTAGVLQKTHKGYLDKESPIAKSNGSNGNNGNSNGQSLPNLFEVGQIFDDRSFYGTLESLLDVDGSNPAPSTRPSKDDFAPYDHAISETERRLEDFNNRLRQAISQPCTQNQTEPVPPLRGVEDGHDPASALNDQLDYFARNFSSLQQIHIAAAQDRLESIHATEKRLGNLNVRLGSIITRTFQGQNSEYPLPSEVAKEGPGLQVDHLEAEVDVLEQSIQQLTGDNRSLASMAAGGEEASHYKTVLLGLWEILIGGEEDLRRQDPVQREVLNEDFSLQLFSNKVQTLFARATGLQEQKEILARQVQQQRELNNQTDTSKDVKVSELTIELGQARKLVAEKEREAKEARDSLVLMTERINMMRQEASHLKLQKGMNENKALAAEKEARQQTEERLLAELSEKQNQLTVTESEFAETKDDFGIANAEILGRLEESEKRFQSLSSDLKASLAEREKSQRDMQDLEGQLVRLQTELTVAKAELDAAYGTRAERAAEATANPVKQQEFDELTAQKKYMTEELESLKGSNSDMNQRMQTLQRELTETIGEYETMTQSTIAFEREREQLEKNLDALRDRCESLETQLNEEKVRCLGMKSPSSGAARDPMSPGTTSTQVLKNEFKKMMRDMRAENSRALRHEQEERRKLENLVRTLKRDQTPTKSSLSQSMTAE